MRRLLRKLSGFVFILSVCAMVLLIFFRVKYHGTIRTLAETQVKNTTSDLINDAIDAQIENGNIQYDRIVYFEKDLNGKITLTFAQSSALSITKEA